MAGKAKAARPTTTNAVDVAMDLVGDDEVARTLLEKHGRLVDQQIRGEKLEHRNKLAMIAFRSVLAAAALAVVVGFGWMVFNARSDHGLVIEALSVPPDLVARGLTGEAMAANLADKLAEIDSTARSFRSPETMTVNWGNEVKIQIPETGVSIGEVDAFLRRTLGGQTTIGGAVFRTPQGLRLTVRAGGSGAVEQVGSDTELEAMIQKAAEGVFAKTQAYRYSKYLEFKGRTGEAMAVVRSVIQTDDDPQERAWAWAQVSNLLLMTDTQGAVAAARRAIREDPANPLAYLNGCIAAGHLSHDRESNWFCNRANKLGTNPQGGLSEIGVNTSRANAAFDPTEYGDFALALKQVDALRGPLYPGVRENRDRSRASLLLSMHDVPESRRLFGNVTDQAVAASFSGASGVPAPQYADAIEVGDYDRAVLLSRQLLEYLKTNPESAHLSAVQSERVVRPRLAMALAFTGRLNGARSVVAALPLDCVACLRARMVVAGMAGDIAGARQWADRARRAGANPLLSDLDMARLHFKNRKWSEALEYADRGVSLGPNNADVHKLRGDSLRRLGRLDEATKAYATAAGITPKWGRLWIDWGIAELRHGDQKAARERFAEAASRFLSPADQRVLARMRTLAGGV